jgi:uncharacterized protein
MAKQEFDGQMVRIHLSESDRWQGRPTYDAILDRCLELGIASATVFRGLEGFGTSARIRHASRWPLSKDAPIMVSVIDSKSRIETLIPFLDAMVVEGVVAISDVQIVLYGESPRESGD